MAYQPPENWPPAQEPAPDAENNTPEAPAHRPQPLAENDKADTGCLVVLFFMFVGVFFLPAFVLLGGAPFIVPAISILLLILVTPFVNPTDRFSGPAKWWGRVITFLVLVGLIIGAWIWIKRSGDEMPVMNGPGAAQIGLP